jgi:hypothetical protein
MKRSNWKLQLGAIGIIALLAGSAGCDKRGFYTFLPAGFGVGFVAGSLLGTRTVVERECFVNGEAVDCSELSVPVQ